MVFQNCGFLRENKTWCLQGQIIELFVYLNIRYYQFRQKLIWTAALDGLAIRATEFIK